MSDHVFTDIFDKVRTILYTVFVVCKNNHNFKQSTFQKKTLNVRTITRSRYKFWSQQQMKYETGNKTTHTRSCKKPWLVRRGHLWMIFALCVWHVWGLWRNTFPFPCSVRFHIKWGVKKTLVTWIIRVLVWATTPRRGALHSRHNYAKNMSGVRWLDMERNLRGVPWKIGQRTLSLYNVDHIIKNKYGGLIPVPNDNGSQLCEKLFHLCASKKTCATHLMQILNHEIPKLRVFKMIVYQDMIDNTREKLNKKETTECCDAHQNCEKRSDHNRCC